MVYYKIENGKIIDALEYNDEQFVPQEIKDNYLVTDKEIVNTTNGLMFADNVNQQVEEQAILEQIKANKINELKTARDTEEISPIEYGGYRWDFDEKSIQRINGAIIALGENDTITWTSADNTEIRGVNAEDLRNVIKASAIRSNMVHVKYRELRERVERCETVDEISVIHW